MTLRQEAYGLIDRLPDDSIQAVIQIMVRMLPNQNTHGMPRETGLSQKMRAFMEMQEMRKHAAEYEISLEERAAAVDAKYGTLD